MIRSMRLLASLMAFISLSIFAFAQTPKPVAVGFRANAIGTASGISSRLLASGTTQWVPQGSGTIALSLNSDSFAGSVVAISQDGVLVNVVGEGKFNNKPGSVHITLNSLKKTFSIWVIGSTKYLGKEQFPTTTGYLEAVLPFPATHPDK